MKGKCQFLGQTGVTIDHISLSEASRRALRKLGARAKPLHGIGAFMTEMTAHPK